MKTKYLVLTTILLLVSCDSLKNTYNRNDVQTYHSSNGSVHLTGLIKRADFQRFEYRDWYNNEYGSYQTKLMDKKQIQKLFDGVTIEVFLGTWCSDSQREVPRFLKIMDTWGIESSKIKLVAVNEKKIAFKGEELGKRITNVPTFIFYKKDALVDHSPSERGRIIESPNETLEQDILKILNADEPYIPHLEQ